ncbi:MAG: acyl-CoA dehydrogenase, partial [Gallionella sp.]
MLTIVAVGLVFILLAFMRASISSWLLAMMVIVPIVAIQASISETALQIVYLTLFLFVVFFGIPFLRRAVISSAMLKIFRKVLPQISATEQEAIDAGTVWWDGELFSGNPDWHKLHS